MAIWLEYREETKEALHKDKEGLIKYILVVCKEK